MTDDGRILPAALHTAANCGGVEAGGRINAVLPTPKGGEGQVGACRAPTDRFRTTEAVNAAPYHGQGSQATLDTDVVG